METIAEQKRRIMSTGLPLATAEMKGETGVSKCQIICVAYLRLINDIFVQVILYKFCSIDLRMVWRGKGLGGDQGGEKSEQEMEGAKTYSTVTVINTVVRHTLAWYCCDANILHLEDVVKQNMRIFHRIAASLGLTKA